MSKITLDTTDKAAIGDAIRTKLAVETPYKASGMPAAILNIPGGGITPTGTISIDSNGDYDVTQYASAEVDVQGGGDVAWNEPIVRNWDFSNPLNTRGQQSYSGAASINGWTCVSGTTCVIGTGGIYVRGTGTNMYYWFPIDGSDYIGKQMTLSLLVDGVFATNTVTIPSTTGSITTITASNVTLWMNLDSSTRLAVGFYHSGGGNNSLIQAVKLEFGDTQTLAKQENGIWQLIRGQNLDVERAFLRRMATNF